MSDRRRYLGAVAILGIVLLRLAVGWHFYREGSSKFSYDPASHRFKVNSSFSAESFLSQAKGPLADWFRSLAPDGHGWSEWDVVARPELSIKASRPELDFAEDWSRRITDDWQTLLTKFSAIPGLTEEQRKSATAAFDAKKKELSEYLSDRAEEIAEYQNELERTARLRATPEAREVPFVERRIATETAKNRRTPLPWVAQVESFDEQFVGDLRGILSAEQQTDAAVAAAADEALTTDEARRLKYLNIAVAYLTVGVGILLLVGFFTRLAAIVGAVFLLAVIATQPPWISGATPTYYQMIELAGLIVLAGAGAGRWAGLDFFGYALCSRFCWRSDREA
jgi:uncharacterized membrane protein YphA (DoxX/SURF4 family)